LNFVPEKKEILRKKLICSKKVTTLPSLTVSGTGTVGFLPFFYLIHSASFHFAWLHFDPRFSLCFLLFSQLNFAVSLHRKTNLSVLLSKKKSFAFGFTFRFNHKRTAHSICNQR
jgi:hypothetical protein